MRLRKRAFAYLRVSTPEQARHDLSMPDQGNQIQSFADQRGIDIIEVFQEPGASARDENRPVLQEMMARALAKPPEADVILVHSMSRLFRDELAFEFYRRKLEKNGVQIISITQDFGEGTGADFARRMLALADELQSVETAKHVRRTMLENARQNYWNGSSAPLGYRTVVADIRGTKQKKRLEIDPEGSQVIKLIFRLYLDGDGVSGPLGIKNIVSYLNDHGHTSPKGGKFHISYVGKILRDEVYVGRAWYNKFDTRAKVDRPKEEWIAVQVPPIISEEDFQRVATQLAARNPKKTPPRLVNSPVLLTGVVCCGSCGRMMHRQSGKAGAYTYYRCSGKMRFGECDGGASIGISAPVLDRIVLDKVMDELLTAERVQAIVAEVATRRASGSEEAITSLGQLKEERKKANGKLRNLLNALAEGIVEASETFKTTVKGVEGDQERLNALIAVQERLLDSRLKSITIEEARLAASQLREKLLDSAPSLKKRIVRSFVDKIVVTADNIIITGAKSDLAEIVTGTPPDGRGVKARENDDYEKPPAGRTEINPGSKLTLIEGGVSARF